MKWKYLLLFAISSVVYADTSSTQDTNDFWYKECKLKNSEKTNNDPTQSLKPLYLTMSEKHKTYTSLKGFELYSWEENGNWKYSIVPGTNWIKKKENIINTATGIDKLLKHIDCIPSSDYIVWEKGEGLQYPPDSIMNIIKIRCIKEYVRLRIGK